MKRKLPAISAIAYILAWIIGLSTGAPSLALNATVSQIVQAYTTHKTAAILQFIIAEGLTGLFLIVFVSSIYMCTKAKTMTAKVFLASGMLAGALSIIMAVLGITLITSTVLHGSVAGILHLSQTINRLDGPKMWILGLMGFSGVLLPFKLPSWIKIAGVAMGLSLVVSGFAYGLLIQNLNWSVYIAGILLLLWVGSFGIYVGFNKKQS